MYNIYLNATLARPEIKCKYDTATKFPSMGPDLLLQTNHAKPWTNRFLDSMALLRNNTCSFWIFSDASTISLWVCLRQSPLTSCQGLALFVSNMHYFLSLPLKHSPYSTFTQTKPSTHTWDNRIYSTKEVPKQQLDEWFVVGMSNSYHHASTSSGSAIVTCRFFSKT